MLVPLHPVILFSEAGFLTSLGSLIFLDCCVVSKPQAAAWSRSLDLPFHHHRTQEDFSQEGMLEKTGPSQTQTLPVIRCSF